MQIFPRYYHLIQSLVRDKNCTIKRFDNKLLVFSPVGLFEVIRKREVKVTDTGLVRYRYSYILKINNKLAWEFKKLVDALKFIHSQVPKLKEE